MWPFGRRFPFREAPDTAALTCCHVLAGAPILHVTHDAEDGMWQFLCGGEHDASEARVIALREAYALDASVGQLAKMPCGCAAQRSSKRGKWQISEV